MNSFFSAFKYLSREIQFYLIPGSLIFLNIVWIFKNEEVFSPCNYDINGALILIALVISYFLGHFSLGLRELMVRFLTLSKAINLKHFKRLKKYEKESSKPKMDIKIRLDETMKDAYDFYIDRYNHLHAIRKNFTWSNVVMIIMNLSFYVFKNCENYGLIACINLIFIVVFGFYTVKTRNDFLMRKELILKN